MVFVLEARDGVVRLLLEEGAGDAARFLRFEQRQPPAMDQVMHESGNEYRLAGAGKTGDAQPQRWREEPHGTARQGVERNPRLVGKGGQR